MLNTLTLLPLTFWLAIIIFGTGVIIAMKKVHTGLGIPILAVLMTVFFWYVGDVFYNDYKSDYYRMFSDSVLFNTWLQVSGFLVSFLLFAELINRKRVGQLSSAYSFYKKGVGFHRIQISMTFFFKVCAGIWLILVVFALFNVGEKVVWFVFPILGQRVNPFARGQIGGGLSAFYSLAQYFYILAGAGFGIVTAISKNKKIFWFALLGCFLVWPYFLLDRTRSSMIAVCLPGILSLVFFRLRTNVVRWGVLIMFFLVFNIWFLFVMDARGQGSIVTKLFFQSDMGEIAHSQSRHLGLNMYEELCWLNTFIREGFFSPNWGQRYFAELVNPIPRALWPGKPLIGLDYAIARGQFFVGGQGAVSATVSTGMIGQGINNFGLFFGTIAAAIIMAIWVNILAGIDTLGKNAMRLPLFGVGLVLTFNMGRDITLLVLYPFVFGWLVVKIIERKSGLKKTTRVFR